MSSTKAEECYCVWGNVPAKRKNPGAGSPVYVCRLNAAKQRQDSTFLFLTLLLIKLLPKQLLLLPLLPTVILIYRGAKYT